MKMRRRLFAIATVLTLVAPGSVVPYSAAASGNASAPAAAVAAPGAAPGFVPLEGPVAQVAPGFEPVAQTANMALFVNRANSKLIVQDKRNGKLWTSNPLEPAGDQKSLLDDAVFLLNYTNARRQMTNLASSASEAPELSYQNIPNGVRVTYDIKKLSIKLSIDYAIKEEARVDVPGVVPYLEVTVPNDQIQETGDCSIPTSTTCFKMVTLELLPLFGAAPVGSNGYLMVPDGAGAIVTFKNEHAQYRQRYSSQIYGTDAASQAFTTGGRSSMTRGTGRTPTRMPLWGLKHDDTAYAGIVTKGEYQANINAYLAGYITNSNRGSTEFIFRRQASIPRRRTLFVNRIEDERLQGDRQVRYVLLTGEDANYAGMAKIYRNHLMKERGLQRLAKEPVRQQVDFYMGITRRRAFKEDFVPMTTFDQGITMIQGLMDRGMRNFDVGLLGWNDDGQRGRWPRRYPAEEALGGNDGLRRLIDFAHQNGIRVFLEDNYLFGYTMSSGGIFGQIPYLRNLWPNWSYGFNTRFDTIRGVNKLPVFEGAITGLYLINPVIARTDYAERDMPTHKRFGADGLNLTSMGYFLPSDTNERYPLSREQVAEEWNKIAELAKQELGNVMFQGPNDYVLEHTERVYDAPELSLDAFGDEPVPIYHIATQGLVPRLSRQANLRNDPQMEFLRMLEWGMTPGYELTHQPTADLIRVGYNSLFSAQFKDWADVAAKEYNQVRDEFGYLGGQFMTAHDKLAFRVHRTTFEDGSQLIVNYNSEPYNGPEGRVDGLGYLLKKGGSQ
jgi:hypothetical protein